MIDDPEVVRWKHRRRMAYIALGALLGIIIALLFGLPVTRLESLGDMTDWMFITLGSVVGAYMGLSTFEHLGKKK